MAIINYNEFQPGQGVSAPALNENFSLTKGAIDDLEMTVNSTVTTLNSTMNLKADRNGSSSQKFNVANGTEDTNAINFAQLKKTSPVGSVIWYAGDSAPDGYLLCNGNAVSRNVYSALFEVIGIKYGSGNGVDTFNLPMLTDGRFVEGYTSAGTSKDAGLPNITGQFHQHKGAETHSASGAFSVTTSYHDFSVHVGDGANSTANYSFNASRSNSVYGKSDTVQPKSLTLLPCIKY